MNAHYSNSIGTLPLFFIGFERISLIFLFSRHIATNFASLAFLLRVILTSLTEQSFANFIRRSCQYCFHIMGVYLHRSRAKISLFVLGEEERNCDIFTLRYILFTYLM